MAIYLGTDKVSLAGTNGGYMLNGRLVADKTYSFNLGQTNFTTKLPNLTTSNTTLTLPTTTYTTTASNSATFFRIGVDYDNTAINRNLHDYVIFNSCIIEFNYGSNNVSGTIHGIRSACVIDYQQGKYHNLVNASTGISTTTVYKNASYIQSSTPFLYQKADNTYDITTSQGIFASYPTIATFGTSNNNDYINLQFSNLSARYNDTYCPLACLQALNPASTIITLN